MNDVDRTALAIGIILLVLFLALAPLILEPMLPPWLELCVNGTEPEPGAC